MTVTLTALPGLPRVEAGDDLPGLVLAALTDAGMELQDGDVVVVCQKVVSKAEGRIVALSSVEPSARARDFAERWEKDAAVVELALREATDVLRMDGGHLITATGPGFVCANSGLDRSNQNAGGEVTLLPIDADRSAARMRARLEAETGKKVAVVVSDTFGRPWRLGQLDVAIGASGFEVLDDHGGRRDWSGRELEHTSLAVADQLAAAAGLVTAKEAGLPVVLVRGYRWREGDGRAADLVRPRRDDLFR